MQVVSEAQAQTFTTPNAVMRTFASPQTTGSGLAVWRVEMAAGSAGPWHAVDTEQVVVVLEGSPTVATEDEERVLVPGDAVVLEAAVGRRISNGSPGRVVTLTASAPGATATRQDGEAVPLPWAR